MSVVDLMGLEPALHLSVLILQMNVVKVLLVHCETCAVGDGDVVGVGE